MTKSRDQNKPANDNLSPNRRTRSWPWGQEKVLWPRKLTQVERDNHERRLKPVLDLAPHIPVLKEALEWARAHDVAIMVDEQCTAGGYYISGTGVVVMGVNLSASAAQAVDTLVHEIRHCWQDYYGMIPRAKGSFTKDYIAVALIEADAYAHGRLAREQYYRWRSRLSLVPEDEPTTEAFLEACLRSRPQPPHTPSERAAFLWQHFQGWFFEPARAGWYGQALRDRMAADLGVKNVKRPDYKFRFAATRSYAVGPGIDTARREELLRLGKGFDNRNYLAQADADFFQKLVFRPELARQFFKASKRKPGRVMREIERRQHPKAAKKPQL